jgi:hypothetical protein
MCSEGSFLIGKAVQINTDEKRLLRSQSLIAGAV